MRTFAPSLFFFLFFSGCFSQNPPLPSQPQTQREFEDDLKSFLKECKRKADCYETAADSYIYEKICRLFKTHGFPSFKACEDKIVHLANRVFTDDGGYFEKKRKRKRKRRSRRRAPDPPPPIEGFCDRTDGVKRAILSQLENTVCGQVTQAHLDRIIQLRIALNPRPTRTGLCPEGRSSLRSGDFSNMPNLKGIFLGGATGVGCLDSVPADIFSGLSKLEEIYFGHQTHLTSFPEDVFRNLESLKKITPPECADERAPAFQNLGGSVHISFGC